MVEARMDESNQSHERKVAWSLVETPRGGRFNPFGDSKEGAKEGRGPNSPSTGSLSSLSQSELLESPASTTNPSMYPHVRTIFKNQSYMPPVPSASRLSSPPVTRRQAAWDDEDMPFDQMRQSKRPVQGQGQVKIPVRGSPARKGETKGDRPFDEAPDDELLIVGPGSPKQNASYSEHDGGGGARSVQVLRAYYSDTDSLHASSAGYMSPPQESITLNKRQPLSPEHSEATTRIHSNSHPYDDALRNGADMGLHEDPIDEAKELYEEFGLSPGSTTGNSSPRNARPRGGAPKVEMPEPQQGNTDEDSPLNFEADRKRKKVAAVKDRRERRAQRIEDDSSSVEPDQDVSLQERAQQAFMTRNKKNPKIATPKEPAVPTTPKRPIKERRANSPGSVSFDEKPATVYHYVTEEEEEETVVSISHRSINSEYTKSMESEVEDVIKDLLFIGAGSTSKPGRRFIKDQPVKKRELRMKAKKEDDSWGNDESSALETLEEDSVLDETTNFTGQTSSTLNGEDLSLESASTRSRNVSPVRSSTRKTNLSIAGGGKAPAGDDDIPDPLTAMWEFMEVGVFAMTEALGIAPTQCNPTKVEDKSQPITLARYSTEQNAAATETMKHRSTRTISPVQSTMEYASHLLVGPNGEVTNIQTDLKQIEEEGPLTSLETDPRLAELALYTARSVHEIQGLVLDESCNVELVTQLEFHVVKIGLPLGILFQENGGGCWVANVFPDGNAAKKAQGDGVKVGDQLAAIDGRSSIKMKVDDICALISEAENTQSIELTFLRYAGPLHPVDGPFFEGYEMTDNSGTDMDDANETRTDNNTTTREHEFDTMHKALRASKSEEKTILKKSKKSTKKEGKKRFRLFGRKEKTAQF